MQSYAEQFTKSLCFSSVVEDLLVFICSHLCKSCFSGRNRTCEIQENFNEQAVNFVN